MITKNNIRHWDQNMIGSNDVVNMFALCEGLIALFFRPRVHVGRGQDDFGRRGWL